MSNCKVISVVSQKGGVSKTTTTANLGIGLANHGKKVCLIDLDPQSSLTISLGWRNPEEIPATISTVISNVIMSDLSFPEKCILHHEEGVDLIPSSIGLSGLEMRMMNAVSRESVLRDGISEIKENYDFLIIDCGPTLGVTTINALSATDSVIIPVSPEYLSVVGMTQLFDTMQMVKTRINPNLKIEGILITMANMRTNLSKNTVELIKKTYGNNVKIYPTPIPYSIKVAEASGTGKSIYAYDKSNRAVYAYEELAKEVLQNGKQRGTIIRNAERDDTIR